MQVRAALFVSVATIVAVGSRMEAPPVSLLTISPETTYLTEPLRDDGTPDYALVLNRKYGAGVTLDNNAAVPLLGKELLHQPPDVLGPLGVDPSRPPQDLEVIATRYEHKPFEAYLRKSAGANGQIPGIGSLPADFSRQFSAQTHRALSAPWAAADAPLAAAWLRAHQGSLTRLAEIVRSRPRYWVPTPEELPREARIPVVFPLRTLTDLLRARMLQSASSQEDAAAFADAATVLRLAALLDQSPWLVVRITAASMRGTAAEALVTLTNPPGSRTAAKVFLEDLGRLPPRQSFDDALDAERLHRLAGHVSFYRAARRSPSAWSERVQAYDRGFRDQAASLGSGPWRSRFASVPAWAIDWDEMLRTFNRCELNLACRAEEEAAHADLEWAKVLELIDAARSDPAARQRIGRALLTDEPGWQWFGFSRARYAGMWGATEAQLRVAIVSAVAAVAWTEIGRYPADARRLAAGSVGLGFDPSRPHAGYAFAYSVAAGGSRFSYTAAPEAPEQGARGFCADSSGRFAETSDGQAPRVIDGLCDPAAKTRSARRVEQPSKP